MVNFGERFNRSSYPLGVITSLILKHSLKKTISELKKIKIKRISIAVISHQFGITKKKLIINVKSYNEYIYHSND